MGERGEGGFQVTNVLCTSIGWYPFPLQLFAMLFFCWAVMLYERACVYNVYTMCTYLLCSGVCGSQCQTRDGAKVLSLCCEVLGWGGLRLKVCLQRSTRPLKKVTLLNKRVAAQMIKVDCHRKSFIYDSSQGGWCLKQSLNYRACTTLISHRSLFGHVTGLVRDAKPVWPKLCGCGFCQFKYPTNINI